MWKKNVKDIDGEVLCVSQFTLLANTPKGKPDFHRAMVRSSAKLATRTRDGPLTASLSPSRQLAARLSQASGPSRDLYGSFLKRMGELYGPEKIKGASGHLVAPDAILRDTRLARLFLSCS